MGSLKQIYKQQPEIDYMQMFRTQIARPETKIVFKAFGSFPLHRPTDPTWKQSINVQLYPSLISKHVDIISANIKQDLSDLLDRRELESSIAREEFYNDLKANLEYLKVIDEINKATIPLVQRIKRHPTEVIKGSSILLGVFSVLSLTIGKLLDRVIIAPDFGLFVIVSSLAIFAMAHLETR